jgi:hypothetical protein
MYRHAARPHSGDRLTEDLASDVSCREYAWAAGLDDEADTPSLAQLDINGVSYLVS